MTDCLLAAALLDSTGVTGVVFQTCTGVALISTAAVVLIRLWRKGRLDMDEGPKMQMLESDELHPMQPVAEED